MKKKRMLVCGAGGFLGRNILEYFAKKEGFEVYGTYHTTKPSLENVSLINCDLTDRNAVDNIVKGKDVVIQMASVTSGVKDVHSRPYIHVTDNAIMNSLILRAAFDNGIEQFIFPSCSTVYQSSDFPLKEEEATPDNLYPSYFGSAKTKLYIEDMCKFFSGLGRTKHTVFRHSNIYGPYDKFDLNKSHVFGASMTKVMSAEDNGVINVWGNGEEERDLLYVNDFVNFIENSFSQSTAFELVNVGSGRKISVRNLIQKLIDLSGKNLRMEYDSSKPTIKTKVCLDITKAYDKFGWLPKTSLDEGIKRTMSWYKENILRGGKNA